MPAPKVHILVLNYNGADLLKKNLPSLVAACERSRRACRVSVVDNASADSSREAVAAWGGKVGWMPMPKNRVLCAYNDAAAALEDDILVFMNNDIEVEPGFVDPIVDPFERAGDVFFTTMRCLSRDRRYEGNRTRGRIRYGIFWSSSIYPGHELDSETPGPTLQGGFGAVDRKKFLALGGYDDLYLPGRLEDADLCFRAYKRGWRCLYEPSSVVYHEGGVSFHRAFGVRGTLVMNARNTFLFMWKNLSDARIWVAFAFWLPIRLAHSLVTLKPELCMGFFQALGRLGPALRRRAVLKRAGLLRSVSDRQILGQT